MPRRKTEISIANYGRYTPWNKSSRKLPKIIHYTDTIEAIEGNEFGIIINVDNAKGKVLDFMIKHPPIKDEKGNLMPQFKGQLFVHSLHTQFYVGDGIWPPAHEKIGTWEIYIYLDKVIQVSKKFVIVAPSDS